MWKAVKRLIRDRRAMREARNAERYFAMWQSQPWSAIGDTAWELYVQSRMRAARIASERF